MDIYLGGLPLVPLGLESARHFARTRMKLRPDITITRKDNDERQKMVDTSMWGRRSVRGLYRHGKPAAGNRDGAIASAGEGND